MYCFNFELDSKGYEVNLKRTSPCFSFYNIEGTVINFWLVETHQAHVSLFFFFFAAADWLNERCLQVVSFALEICLESFEVIFHK